MAGFAVITLLTLHTIVFAIHSFVVFRYDSLYEQMRSSGATIHMPEDFLLVQK